jgi:hypothetical protein
MQLKGKTVERLHTIELAGEIAGFEDDFTVVRGGHAG